MSFRTNRRTRTKFPNQKFLEVWRRTKGAGEKVRPVRDFGKDYDLIQTDVEVYEILRTYTPYTNDNYQFLLTKTGDAEFKEIWGIRGTPYLDADAVLLYRS